MTRTSNIPNIQLETVLNQALDVEPLCGHDVVDLLICELFQAAGFASIVKTKEKNANFRISTTERAKKLQKTHCRDQTFNTPDERFSEIIMR